MSLDQIVIVESWESFTTRKFSLRCRIRSEGCADRFLDFTSGKVSAISFEEEIPSITLPVERKEIVLGLIRELQKDLARLREREQRKLTHEQALTYWFYHNNCWQRVSEFYETKPGTVIPVDEKTLKSFPNYLHENVYRFVRDHQVYGLADLNRIPHSEVPGKSEEEE